MAHLKHSGKVRQAAHAKRTALIEIYSDEPAVNDDRIEADVWPMPGLSPIKSFAQIEREEQASARAIVRGVLAAQSDRDAVAAHHREECVAALDSSPRSFPCRDDLQGEEL